MANINPSSPTEFSDIYQIETTDFVLGGAGQVANRQAQGLVNRTQYLKELKENEYSPYNINNDITIPVNGKNNYKVVGENLNVTLISPNVDGFVLKLLNEKSVDVNYVDDNGVSTSKNFPANSYVEMSYNGVGWKLITPFEVNDSQTLDMTPDLDEIVIGGNNTVLTLNGGLYVGQEITIVAKANCSVIRGNITDVIENGDIITYIWNGTAWEVKPGTVLTRTITDNNTTFTPITDTVLLVGTTNPLMYTYNPFTITLGTSSVPVGCKILIVCNSGGSYEVKHDGIAERYCTERSTGVRGGIVEYAYVKLNNGSFWRPLAKEVYIPSTEYSTGKPDGWSYSFTGKYFNPSTSIKKPIYAVYDNRLTHRSNSGSYVVEGIYDKWTFDLTRRLPAGAKILTMTGYIKYKLLSTDTDFNTLTIGSTSPKSTDGTIYITTLGSPGDNKVYVWTLSNAQVATVGIEVIVEFIL